MAPLDIHGIGKALLAQGELTLEGLPSVFQKSFPDISPKYIDHLSLLAGIAAVKALEGIELDAATRGDFSVVLGSGLGALDSVVDFDAQALLKGPNAVNPMDFPNTVANAAGSRVGIWLQLKGPNVTLTNGDTAFLDVLGFAWEASKSGLFKRGLVGAIEKVPSFMRPLARKAFGPVELREGACFLLAAGEGKKEPLFQVVDHFSFQMRPDMAFPAPFRGRLESLWEGVGWLGGPKDVPLGPGFPAKAVRWEGPDVLELGLGGLGALEAFLGTPYSIGVLAAHSKGERKVSFVKIAKKTRSV